MSSLQLQLTFLNYSETINHTHSLFTKRRTIYPPTQTSHTKINKYPHPLAFMKSREILIIIIINFLHCCFLRFLEFLLIHPFSIGGRFHGNVANLFMFLLLLVKLEYSFVFVFTRAIVFLLDLSTLGT